MSFLKKIIKSNHFFPLLLIFFMGLVVFFWFKEDLIFSYGDVQFNFAPLNTFKNYFFVWHEQGTGWYSASVIPQLFYKTILAVWEWFGWPLYIFQRLLYYLLFVIGGLSTYYLICTIIKDQKRYLIGFLAGIFYMFNIYALVMVWYMGTQIIFIYPWLAFLLAFFIRGLEKKKFFKYIFLFNVISFFASISFSNIAFAVLIWLLIFAYFVYFLVINCRRRSEIIYSIKFFIILFFTWLLINCFWLLAMMSEFWQMLSFYTKNIAYSGGTERAIIGASTTTFLLNVFRLFGYHPFDNNLSYAEGDWYHSYSPVYTGNIFFIILSFIIPLFVFSSLFWLRKERKEIKFYLTFFLIFSALIMWLYKGSQAPWGDLLLSLYKKISLLSAFRHPMGKFGSLLVMSYAVLFGYSLANFYYWLKDKLKKNIALPILLSLFILLLIVYPYPFWRGQVFHEAGKYSLSSLVRVPDYYYQAGKWLASDQDLFRVVPLPMVGMFGIALDWDYGYDGADPSYFMIRRPLTYIIEENGLEAKFWQYISGDKKLNIVAKIAGFLNVKYIMLHKDIKKDYFNMPKVSYDRTVVNLETGINDWQKDNSFGRLDFYKIDDKYFLPRIYSPRVITFSSGPVSSLEDILSQDDFIISNAIWFNVDLEQDDNNDQRSLIIKGIREAGQSERRRLVHEEDNFIDIDQIEIVNQPQISFKRLAPTKYLVNAREIKGPFFLIFNEKFSQDWRLYFADANNTSPFWETWFKDGISPKDYLQFNLYNNSWWIEPPVGQKDLNLIIEFWPQRLVYWGFSISILTWLSLIISGIVFIARRKKIAA